MSVKDPEHWVPKLIKAEANRKYNPCHYHSFWEDRYADISRKRAVKKVLSPKVIRRSMTNFRVLDVGCGNGLWGAWFQKEYDAKVYGIDAYHWPGVGRRLNAFRCCDAQNMFAVLDTWDSWFDMAMCVTSLPFMEDWEKVVRLLSLGITKVVLVVDNFQQPTPPWQRNCPEKTHIEYDILIRVFEANGFIVSAERTVSAMDRALFIRSGVLLKPPAFLATLLVDFVTASLIKPKNARYSAILFRKV